MLALQKHELSHQSCEFTLKQGGHLEVKLLGCVHINADSSEKAI